MNERNYHWLDKILSRLNHGLNAFVSSRPNPSINAPSSNLSADQKRYSAGLMRVNHTGEVCAQALYLGQSFATRDQNLKQTLKTAGQEEVDHLHWCEQRLRELESHTSYLNPLWYAGSFAMGFCAGIAGHGWNLGFLAETEHQVGEHLGRHLKLLPEADHKSRAIVWQMQIDEAKHEHTAVRLGAKKLPIVIKLSMRFTAKIMTTLAYYI